jgi:flagellar hook-associated protein 3 FlgL
MTDYISTQYLHSSLALSLMKLQSSLATAQAESASGQYADTGLHLGAQSGQEISLQNENGLLQTYTDTNSMVATSLSTTQAALDTIRSNAQTTLDNLTQWTGSGSSDSAGAQLQELGASGLQSLVATGNASVNGQYVFAGINSSVAPMTDYFAAPAMAQSALQSAFASYLGGLSPPATPQTITGPQMQSFLASSAFTGQFQGAAWASNWSSASSTDISSNISPTETINTSTNANQPGFQQLAQAYAMLNEFTGVSINTSAMQVVAGAATALVASAVSSLTTSEATIGAAQQRVTDANANMAAQMTILQTQIGNLDNVNAYQTATLVNSLTTQIQTAYSLTAALQKLSLVNYL